jgi:hypothetical protein
MILSAWGDVLTDPGDLLLLQVCQRQVVHVGRLQLSSLAVGEQVSARREQQQCGKARRNREDGQLRRGGGRCFQGPVSDQADVQREQPDKWNDAEVE